MNGIETSVKPIESFESKMNGCRDLQKHEEYQYLDHIKNIINNGTEMKDRTGVGTMSIFGAQMKWTLKDGMKYFEIKFNFSFYCGTILSFFCVCNVPSRVN